MHVAGIVLGCMLLGQASNQHLMRPPTMVAEAILLPAGSNLTGQPLDLLTVLKLTADRRQQLECVRAYWRLAQAVAEYRYCFNQVQGLAQVKARSGDGPLLRSSQAAAAAQLREAELDAVRAQQDLAALLRLPAGAALPLPADRPHVGAYRTMFNELFATQTPPESARLAEKTLPLQRQVIDDQAAAVEAAEDALAAVAEDYQTGRANAAAVLSCSGQLLVQQRAFIRSACGYNRNIADYGLSVMPPETTPQTLVAVLIGPAQPAVAPAAGSGPAVQPAGATEPIPSSPTKLQPVRNEPTLAPPRSRYDSAPATPGDRWKGSEPTPAPPRETPPATPADVPATPLVPVDPAPSFVAASPSSPPEPRTTNKPVRRLPLLAEGSGFGVQGSNATNQQSEIANHQFASPMYPALVNASPTVRAKQLAIALHWDHSLPEGQGKSISLMDCLLRDPGSDRQTTINAYWLVRQRAAHYQLLLQQAEFLDALVPVALDRRNEPSGRADMLRLNAAQLATKAEAAEARVALVEAQYALALRIGAVADALWPLASTIPHSGSYQLRLDAQPRGLADSRPVRRLAAAVPALSESVQQHATATVEADQARVAAAEKYRAGAAAIDEALDGVAMQTEQSTAFLDSLTAYNRAIAEYALTVLPPATPADQLVASLVVKP